MRILDAIVDGCALLAAALIPLVMIGISLNVAARYLFASPLGWIFEATEFALLCIPFLAMAWLVRSSGHVRIDIVLENLPPAPRVWFGIVTAIISAGVCAFTAYWAAETAWDNWIRNVTTVGIYPMPKGPLILVIAIGFAMTATEFVLLAFRIFTGAEPPHRNDMHASG